MQLLTLSKKVSRHLKISRKKAEEVIKKGFILVNKIEEKRPFIKILDGSTIEIKKKFNVKKIQLLIFNKPKGCITTRNDERKRKTIYDFLPKRFNNFHYIGRLDFNSEGLLLLTDNTNLKKKLEDPKSEIVRRYIVKVEGSLNDKKLKSMNQKIYSEFTYKKPNIKIINQRKNEGLVMFELKEGKNREIRKICDLFNLRVINLKRVSFGKYHLKNIPLGSYRNMTIE